jgi:hypothetical protein
MKTAHRAPLAEWAMYIPRMESGRFTAFSKNGPFGKPGILHSFRGFRPPFGIPPDPQGEGGIPGDYLGITGGAGIREQNFSFMSADRSEKFLKKIQPGPEFFLNFFLKIL